MERQCDNPCMFRYTWPGKDESYICLEHAQQLLNVASAIGLHLQMLLFHQCDQPTLDWPNCKQKVTVKELENSNG